MDLSCGACNGSCRTGNVRCGGYCEKVFHLRCVNVSEYEIDTMARCRNIKFICDGCINFIKSTNENYKNLMALVKENDVKIRNEIDKTNNLVEEAKREIVSELKRNNVNVEKETYASQLKKNSNSAPVILRPKNKQNSEQTEKEVKEKIKPSSLNLQVRGFSKRNDGAVAIRCQNENERVVLSDEIKEKMGNHYDVQIPKMRRPKVLISGLSEDLDKQRIVEAIKKQNNIDCNYLECIKVYKSFKNPRVYNALIETDGVGLEQILTKNKINIEWDRCPVYESCNVMRCYKCWGFNHSSKNCKETNQICAKCSESGHSYKDCKSNLTKCINCVKAKERLNLVDIDVNHDCRGMDCQILIRKRKQEAERVAY